MIYDMTERVKECWMFYDKVLDEKIKHISELSAVPAEKMVKINPAEFIEKNKWQIIDGYKYKRIGAWLREMKQDDNYLISPLDDDVKTAAQISYKEKNATIRIRASKCKVIPLNNESALAFYLRNHRQTLPNLRETAINFGLLYDGQLVGAMTYDLSGGGVRGKSKAKDYELMRLAFARGYSIAGGASRLEKHCEEALKHYGQSRIFSYSNATINSGKVYEALGFIDKKIDDGQPFVICENNQIIRLLSLHPRSTDKYLAIDGRLKTHVGGNKLWRKEI